MPNTNCLENMACPQCGQREQFCIQVTTLATVVDNGIMDTGDNSWDDDSYAQCDECGWTGTVIQLYPTTEVSDVVPE